MWRSVGITLAILCACTAPSRAQDVCTMCHTNRDLLLGTVGDSAKADSLYVDPSEFGESVHGRMGFACTMCHPGMQAFPHGERQPVSCGSCHAAAAQELGTSVHGRPNPDTGEVPATCADCHTNHHILRPSDPESSVYRLTQFEACARCHEDPEKMGAFGQANVETVSSYMHSVHGRGLLEKGLSVAPVCTDCHGQVGDGAHSIQEVPDTASPMNRLHVTQTCGRCHAGILARYDRGIHGEAFNEGNPDAPTCVNCHAEHGVASVASPTSRVNPLHIAQTCTGCHDREDFNQKYGLAPARGSTFGASFHGIALEGGQITVANCESCHGSHEILPSSDPRSTVYPDNLTTTCGGCHPGIGPGVARGRIHVASIAEDGSALGSAVQVFYVLVIAGTVFYALGLIALDQYRYWAVDRPRGGRHA